MGSYDCFCAICGGPFYDDLVAEQPRTAAFLKKWAKEMKTHQSGNNSPQGEHHIADEGEGDDEDLWDEERYYDQNVVSVEDVQWTRTLHVLGLNPDAEGETKAFVSGPGTYEDVGAVDVENGDDPNARGVDLGHGSCYYDFGHSDLIFPFHWCCYKLLAKCITGSFDPSGLDKDLLYSIMHELTRDRLASLDIDYGDASRMQDQKWEVEPGYEFLVCHPLNVPGAKEVISSTFASDVFQARFQHNDLSSRVRGDPFLKMPYDVMFGLSVFISDQDLVNLATASWPVHALLQNNDQFWLQRIKTSFFPWFFELRELLDQDQTIWQASNAQRIFQWAQRSTRPERWLTGPLMGIVNRRRIWRACEQFRDLYRPQEEAKNDASISEEERMIRAYSKCAPLDIISSPRASQVSPARKVFWVKMWSEIRSQTKTLESFWDPRGSLVGISLTPDGQERRLLGIAGPDDGITRVSTRLRAEDWIKGLIVHLPVPTHLEHYQWETSAKGITIILESGRRSAMGDTSGCHMQRMLSADPGWCITGIHGTTGFVTGNLRLTQLGLVQAEGPDTADYSVPPHRITSPRRTELGQLLWHDDYSRILGQSIQEHRGLRLIDGRDRDHVHRGYLPHGLASYGALIWAKDAGQQRALTRLTGSVVWGGIPARHCLSGLSAEYEPSTELTRRAVGVDDTGDRIKPFEMDGPGGEVVTEIEIPVEMYPRDLKVRTSRGRTCSWGRSRAQPWQAWSSIKAPAGETLVGLVVKFWGLDQVRELVDETLGHNEMCVIGGLSMVLEA